MFKKQLPIIFIGLCVVIAVLVLGWSVFVKTDVVAPVQVPVVDDIIVDDINDNIPDDVEDDISEVDTSDWKTYQNEGYGFELKYPLDYTLEKNSFEYILLRKIENEKAEWSISITVKRLNANNSELSFEEFAIKSALDSCVVDGPNGSTYCTEVVEIKPFTNENKISGYEIYLNEVTEDSLGNKTLNRVRGPIFVLDILEQTCTHARGIFFSLDDKGGVLNERERQELTDQVVSTFKFTEYDDDTNWKTYQNGRYGFEFNYPLYYTLEKGTNNCALLRRTEHKKTAWSFNLAIKQNCFDSELSFEEFATKSALDSCVVDDPNKNIYCTEVVEIKPFVNENKISGYEMYLNEIVKDSLGNKISNRTKGPIFAMDVLEQTQAHVYARGIFFDFDGEEDEEALSKQEKQKLTDQVISTLKFAEEKDDTANWRTYKNEKYGYEFKYPYEWNAVPNEHDANTILLGPEATKELSNGGVECNGTLKQGQTFKDFVKELSIAGLGSDFEVEELINGHNVIVNIIPRADIYIMRETKIVSFENNREVFSLYFSHRANFGKYPEDRHKLDLFDQVVSSFKFTEK